MLTDLFRSFQVRIFCVILLLSISFSGYGDSPVFFTNNWKTPDSVLRRMISDAGDLKGSGLGRVKRRFADTGVFFPLKIVRKTNSLMFNIRDKWTAVPVFGFKRGGGAAMYRFGAADDNFFGTMGIFAGYIDVLHEYGDGRDRKSTSFSGFAKWKRFLGCNFLFELIRYDTSIPDFLYKYSGSELGSFIYEKSGWEIAAGRELFPDFFLLLRGGVYRSIIRERSGDTVSAVNDETGYACELYLQMIVDSSVQREYLERGRYWSVLAGFRKSGAPALESDLRLYHLFKNGNNLAFRFLFGMTGSRQYDEKFVTGGVDSFRGFYNRSFCSRILMQANVEYRFLLGVSSHFGRRWLFWQLNFFSDAGQAVDAFDQIGEFFIGSVGVGIRIATIPVSNNLLRIDFSWGYSPYRRFDIVVATAHFF